jgi:glycosyltransferase involved in cell wall biosynthesis
MQQVQTVRPEVELVVVGDGPLRPEWEFLAKSSLRQFRFLGFQPQHVIKKWMNLATVFCVPSAKASSGATEGLGLVFLEAQSMGLPVVSFASGGIPEAVAHGKTGLLAAEGDFETLGKNILLLLENESLWKQMSELGEKRVQDLFDLEMQTAKLEGLYKSVLKASKAI